MKALGKTYDEAEAMGGDFERLPAGGYICRIETVEDVADKEYLSLVYDVATGPKKAFYADEWGKAHPYAHRFVMSYKSTALGMFKARLAAIDASNGTKFVQEAVKGLDEQKLVGKMVGLVIGYEEYVNDRGETRERTNVRAVCSTDRISRGDFTVPELKKLAPKAEDPRDGFTPISDEDLPF